MKHMRIYKRIVCAVLAAVMTVLIALPVDAAVIKGKTGIGMAEWALRAYNEGWKYVYGGSSEGTVDCSGLIRSYCNGKGGGAKALLDASSKSGSISTIPRVHGLGLWCDGHAGVYVGKAEDGTDMVVDARNSKVNVVYSALNSRSWSPWVKWFKIGMITYPDTGWYEFNGSTYYYHNGEFVVGIFTVDGVAYDFGKSGALKGKASATTTAATTTTTATTTAKTTTTAKVITTTTAKTTTKTATKTTTTTAKTTTTVTTSTSETQKNTALRYGDRNDEVTRLQNRLIELGYLGATASGYFGTQTEAAVRLFQKAAGIDADGIAGPTTQALLYSDNAPRYGVTTTTTTTTTTATTTTMTTTATATESTAQTGQTTAPTEQDSYESTDVSETDVPQTPDWESLYNVLEIGSEGDEIIELQEMLKSKGFYEQPLTSYYGSFTRDAVKLFQLSAGVEATGVADPYTQYLLYNGLTAGSSLDADLYGEEYYEFGGDLYDMLGVESGEAVLAESKGLSMYGIASAPEQFISHYGSSGGLATLGVFSQSKPVTVIYKNGEMYELTSDALEELEESIFN